MKQRPTKAIWALILSSVLAITVTGCASKSTASEGSATSGTTTVAQTASSASSATEAYTGEVKTIKIGIGNAFSPMCYLDEDGKLQGYEYETLKKIDELLPQYQFEYEATDFKNILVGLDTHTYDIAVHHYGWNAERDKKYLYANVADFYGSGKELIIAKGSKIAVKSVDDLAVLKIAVGTSSQDAYSMEQYNTAHPDKKINLVYDDGTTEQKLASINNGVYDGMLGEPFNDSLLKESYGDTFDITGSKLFYDAAKKNGCYFIYSYGDEQLRDDIDKALQQLLDNGWEKDLSVKLLGAAYTQELSDTN
jgi:L-cystine transport system substrate-binding protein